MSKGWVRAETNWRMEEAKGFNIWPIQREGHAYKGLIVVMGYDRTWEGFGESYWEIWHLKSSYCLIGVHCSLDQAMKYGAEIAEMADWELIEEPDWDKFAILDLKLWAFVRTHADEIDTDHHGKDLDMDLDAIVPYPDDPNIEPRLF